MHSRHHGPHPDIRPQKCPRNPTFKAQHLEDKFVRSAHTDCVHSMHRLAPKRCLDWAMALVMGCVLCCVVVAGRVPSEWAPLTPLIYYTAIRTRVMRTTARARYYGCRVAVWRGATAAGLESSVTLRKLGSWRGRGRGREREGRGHARWGASPGVGRRRNWPRYDLGHFDWCSECHYDGRKLFGNSTGVSVTFLSAWVYSVFFKMSIFECVTIRAITRSISSYSWSRWEISILAGWQCDSLHQSIPTIINPIRCQLMNSVIGRGCWIHTQTDKTNANCHRVNWN